LLLSLNDCGLSLQVIDQRFGLHSHLLGLVLLRSLPSRCTT
jgi:hypothetical protein